MDDNQQGVQLIESEDDKKKKEAQGTALSSMGSGAVVPNQGVAAGPSTGPAFSATARAQQAAGSTKGSGFTGVGRYLGANVGSRVGQNISGRIAGVGQQARTQLGQAVGRFQTGLGASQQRLGQAQSNVQQAYSGIMSGISPLVTQQQVGPATASTDAGGISGAVTSYQQPGTQQPSLPTPAASDKLTSTDYRNFIASLPPMSAGLKEKYNAWKNTILPMDYGPGSAHESSKKAAENKFFASLTPEEKAEYDSRQYKSNTAVDSQPGDEDAVNAYRTLTQREITAPTGLEQTDVLKQKAAQASQMAEATRTAAGRAALLQHAFGRGAKQYTRGQTALDALLLGRASKELSGARKEAAGIQRQVRSEEKTAQEQARELQSRAQIAGAEAESTVAGAQQRLGTEIAGQKQQYERELDRLTSSLTEQIRSGELTRESANILSGLGIDPEGSQLYNLNKDELASLIKGRDLTDITEATSANLEQLQKINALRKLAGKEQSFTAEDLAKAGQTVGKEAAKFGIGTTKDLKEEIKRGRSDYETLLGQIIPGYKGFGEVIPEAKEFKTETDLRNAMVGQYQNKQSLDQTNARLKQIETNRPKSEKFKSERDYQRALSDYYKQNNKDQLEAQAAELATKVEKANRAENYINRLGAFEYSRGKGNLSRNVELASRIYSGELFDPTTGKLNVDLANEMKKFYDWRRGYTGEREGMFGAGIYKEYGGDYERRKALEKLLAGVGQQFKIKD